ncbi:MAG TPA: 2-oxoacid:acceptor oxidoreductase family protein [Candidatus Acidoferrales bacterium]|nr:2-oxoacid:acceptor oxidoreductase family protein [Candidatus Acidoferrales bacterium]
MTKTKLLIAGHGGQGVLLLSDYIAYTAMLEGKHVAYTPSYGPETRGGKAKCYVVISDEEVDNPIVEEADVEIIMNQPSMEFLNYLRPNGLVLYNASLVDTGVDRDDVRSIGIPATEMADQLKDEIQSKGINDTKMFANAVMFGAFIGLCAPEIDEGRIKESLKYFLSGRKEDLIGLNYLALKKGMGFVQANPIAEFSAKWPFHCIPAWADQ